MARNPSVKNYTIGKGKLYFNKKVPATGAYIGERHLGNAPAVTFNVALDVLDHFDSQDGLMSKDEKAINQITPKFNFTLDEINAENMALLLLSDVEDVTQTADDSNAVALTGVSPGYYYDLGDREVGVIALGYNGGTAIHTVGATLTGGTSLETATIMQVIGTVTEGTLYLEDVSGVFTDGEILSDDNGVPGASVANGVDTFLDTALSVEDTDVPTTFFVAGTDFTVDSSVGRIYIVPGGAINGTTVVNLSITYAIGAATYKRVKGLMNTELEGQLRYISNNPKGNQRELTMWRVSLTPTGDTALIGDAWSTMSFDGEILKDAISHPLNPYMETIEHETV